MDKNRLDNFLHNNGGLSKLNFENAIYQCILCEIAFNHCEKLKDEEELDKLKTKIRKIGNENAIELYLKSYKLSKEELIFVSNIIFNFIYKHDGRSADIQKYKPALYKKQNGTCRSCGIKIEIKESVIDHIIPHSFVGDSINSVNTLQLLCEKCNEQKSNDAWFPVHFFIINGYLPHYLDDVLPSQQ